MKQGTAPLKHAREIAARAARALGFELVEVTLRKEPDGMALCIYVDLEGGVTLADCERFHRAIQPILEDVAYDYMEVSSPGADRPVETRRDFEKHRGDKVEVRLFQKLGGVKQFMGTLENMDDDTVAITAADGETKTFPRKAVALVKPVVEPAENEE